MTRTENLIALSEPSSPCTSTLPLKPELIQHRPRRAMQIEAHGNGTHLAQDVQIKIQTR